MLTTGEIEDHIGAIEGTLQQLEDGEVLEVAIFGATEHRFQTLRHQYREHPPSMAPYLEQLTRLSRRFDELKQSHLADLVDRYHELGELLRAAKSERDELRSLLLELSRASGQVRLDGLQATVTVKRFTARLPKVNSEERVQLRALVLQSELWEQVSILSAARLSAALEQGQFSEADQQAIHELLPPPGHRLVCKRTARQ